MDWEHLFRKCGGYLWSTSNNLRRVAVIHKSGVANHDVDDDMLCIYVAYGYKFLVVRPHIILQFYWSRALELRNGRTLVQ